MTDILELADRVEALDGPNRGIDQDIGCEVFGLPRNDPVPKPYTASLDAAMTLVPEGYAVNSIRQTTEVEKEEHTGDVSLPNWSVALVRQDCAGYRNRKKFLEAFKRGEASTPALALTAAALRAGETK